MAERRKITTTILLFWIGVVVVLLMGVVMAVFWNRLPPQLPWLYSLPWGEKQLIDKLWLVWILGGMEGVLILTRLIARWAGDGDEIVQNTIMTGISIIVLLMVASFTRIMMIFLNT